MREGDILLNKSRPTAPSRFLAARTRLGFKSREETTVVAVLVIHHFPFLRVHSDLAKQPVLFVVRAGREEEIVNAPRLAPVAKREAPQAIDSDRIAVGV